MEKDDFQELIDSGVLQKKPDIQLVKNELESLVEQGFVKGLSEQYFEFDNNLTWEVVYETLLFAERRRIHALVANHIKLFNESNVEAVADVLSYHYKKAGDTINYIWYTALSGKRAAEMYANDDAINHFKKTVSSITNIDADNVGDISVIEERVGDICESSGKHSDAIDWYSRSLSLWAKGSSHKRRLKYLPWKVRATVRESHLCQKIAVACEHDGKYDDSIAWLDKAENLLPKRPGRIRAQIGAARCAVFFRKGEYKSAIKVGKQAVILAKKSKDLKSTAYAYRVLANNYQYSGKLSDAISYNEKSISIYKRLEDYSGIASVSNNLGNHYQEKADLELAIKYLNLSLQSYKKIHNEFGIAIGTFNLANALFDKGEIKKSEKHAKIVINMCKTSNFPPDFFGAVLLLRSYCMQAYGNYVKAGELVERSVALIKKTGQAGLLQNALLHKAEIMIERGNYIEGLSEVKNIQDEITDRGADNTYALACKVTGLAKVKLGLFDEAVLSYEEGIKLLQGAGTEILEAFTRFSQVSAMIDAGYEYPDMITSLNKAIHIFKKSGNELYLERSLALQDKLS